MIVFVATIVPLVVIEFFEIAFVLVSFLGNGVFALYLIVMDIWGSVYAVQVVSLARYFKQQARLATVTPPSSPDRQLTITATDAIESPEHSSSGQTTTGSFVSVTNPASNRIGSQGADAAAALHRVVRHIGIIIIAALVCGISLVVFVLLLYLVPFSPQVNTNGYFACLWGIHVFVEGSAIIVLTLTTYQNPRRSS